jgi:hypothetical protein
VPNRVSFAAAMSDSIEFEVAGNPPFKCEAMLMLSKIPRFCTPWRPPSATMSATTSKRRRSTARGRVMVGVATDSLECAEVTLPKRTLPQVNRKWEGVDRTDPPDPSYSTFPLPASSFT